MGSSPPSRTVSGIVTSLTGEMSFFSWVILDTLALLYPILAFWMIYKMIKFVKPFGS